MLARLRCQIIFHLDCNLQTPTRVVFIQICEDKKIANTHIRSGEEKYIALNTAYLPVILVFKIASVTESIDFHRQRVFSFTQIFGNVKFSRSFTSLAVAHLFSVHPNIHRRFYTAEVEENLTLVPYFRNREVSSVGAYRIIVMGDMGWVGWKQIICICINRYAKTLQFPVAWHSNIIPLSNIKAIFVEIDGPLGRLINPVEFPGSVKRKIIRRLRRIVL
ncbi:hypothetical protein ES703_24296 [subsurface metagenome]